ncbi:MAG: nuclear transport factor 2 family protein [Bdellovibrionales bacterium]|nr:nuclear transport factor 2 family protein [Bdellovibrionales bacterium]
MTNKEKARAYFGAVNRYDTAVIKEMVEETYVQHNPNVPTGRAAFLSLIPKLKEAKTKIENLRMIADGPFVAMQHRWTNAWPLGAEKMLAFHIIRFNEDGLIAEHWSALTKAVIPSASGWQMPSGNAFSVDFNSTEKNKKKAVEWFWEKKWLPSDPELEYQEQHMVVGEGNLVLSVSEGQQACQPAALYDLLSFRGGNVAEHWRVVQLIPQGRTANDNSMFGF